MTEAERIFNGQLFASEVPELIEKKNKAHRLSQDYNNLYEDQPEARNRVLRDLLDSVTIGDHCSFGPNVTIVTPLHPMLGSERRGVVF